MSSSQHSAPKESPQGALLQTRAVLRILVILLAVAGLLWVLYKLTTVILLVVLSVFFAYLVAPLVDLVQRPFRIRGHERMMPRALAIAIVTWFCSLGLGWRSIFWRRNSQRSFPNSSSRLPPTTRRSVVTPTV